MKRESEERPSQRSNSAEKPESPFIEADLQAIAQELGVSCTPGLKNQLITNAKNYFSLKNFWENKENTAEVKADLVKVGRQAKKLVESLEKLSPLGQVAFKQKLPDFERAIGDIRHLQEAAENEMQYLTFGKGGPTKNVPLRLNLVWLAEIYNEHTGKTPSIRIYHSKESSDDPLYRGPFFRFVMAWLEAVEPELVASKKDKDKIGKLIKNHMKEIKKQTKIFLKEESG